MPQTPHLEKHFTASETVRDIGIGIGMSDGNNDLHSASRRRLFFAFILTESRKGVANYPCR